MSSLLQRSCLQPSYSLRRQLIVSFGVPAFLTTALVVALAVAFARRAGDDVQTRSAVVLKGQVISSFARSSNHIAEHITAYINSINQAVQIVVEVTSDRIVGYPDAGWEDDRHVPFFDTDSQRNIYPLKAPPAPLDWNFTHNVNETNAAEHMPCRNVPNPSEFGSTCVYLFQGSCDPNALNPEDAGYYSNCTLEHNNMETGGIVQPTNTSKWLQEKSGDIGVLLKPIFEAQEQILFTGVFFVNSGAGSVVKYPGFVETGSPSYISDGCDWMRQTNPNTNKPLATEEEIARCHPKGVEVPIREYNGLERVWYRHCVEHHDNFHWHGPFPSAFDINTQLITVCRGVFDRITGAIIGVAVVDMDLNDIAEALRTARLYGSKSAIVIVDAMANTVFAATIDFGAGNYPEVYETDFITHEVFQQLRKPLDIYKHKNYTRDEVLQAFLNNTVEVDSGVYSAYPLPLPPATYCEDYHPDFLVIHYADRSVFESIETMEQEVACNFAKLAFILICTGLVGMLTVYAIVTFVSHMLAQPLIWIEEVAWSIVNHQDERANDSLRLKEGDTTSFQSRYMPRTEITELVSEFRSILHGFSGTGASKVAQSPLAEVLNGMTWRSDFQQLYSLTATAAAKKKSLLVVIPDEDTRSDPSSSNIKGDINAPIQEPRAEDVAPLSIVPAPPKKNVGSNIVMESVRLKRKGAPRHDFDQKKTAAVHSSLFWWILILIAIPLVLTNLLICTFVLQYIATAVPSWIAGIEGASLDLERDYLNSSAYLKAFWLELMIQEVIFDLHLLTRMAGWLLFDGVQRSSSFVEMIEATDDCKMYPPDNSCPFFSSGLSVCPCEWQDYQESSCTHINSDFDSRDMERLFWVCQASDADPLTGVRKNVSSNLYLMANETLWWNTTDDLPGASMGRNASGYNTTYDRIRVSSAMATVEFPIYNKAAALRRQRYDLGTYIGFDADGAFTGFSGCSHSHIFLSHWSSDEVNQAFRIAPELCPLGKFGYDPRCRDWYAKGKEMYEEKGSNIYVTPPYLYTDGKTAASASSPIVNPATGEYIGQTLVDFFPDTMREVLSTLKEPVSFVITPTYDITGGNTVVAPEPYSEEWKSANILDFLFPGTNETIHCPLRSAFEANILPDMLAGGSGVTQFMRYRRIGEPEQLLLFAYYPVRAHTYLAYRPDDFARGVNVSTTLVYVVGVASYVEDFQRPFGFIEYDMSDGARDYIYVGLIASISFVFTVYICLITVSITRPIITLLRVVQTIKAGEIEDDLPPLQGGSREVHQVYNSFAKLIKIVRMSNIAFFSGNLDWAHDIISEALMLFRKVEDLKAVGIACNNLGNTLYAMAHKEWSAGEVGDESNSFAQYDAAMIHYNEAVEIGQRGFVEATDEGEKAEFAQQLADRLFNRALFGLLAYFFGTAPEDAKELALSDLASVRELDGDVLDFWLERRLLLKNSEIYFSRLIRRIHGLIDFYEDQDVRQLWDPKKLIEDADQLLSAAWSEPNAPIFDVVTPVGRLQQLEAAAMRLDRLLGKKDDAARLAMRMFVEDEYLLESAFASAAKSLLELIRDDASDGWLSKTKSCCRQDLRMILRSCKNKSVDLGKSVIVALEINEEYEGDPILERIHANCLRLYDAYCTGDDHVGVVAYTVRGDLNVELGLKSENEGRQRAGLDLAASCTNDRVSPALPFAIQMVVDSAASSENDSYIVLVADGYSWDPATFASVRVQIERLNKERNSTVHLFILGVNVEEEEVVESYKSMCKLTKLSLYVDLTMDNIDFTFGMIGGIICGLGNGFQGLTMERF